MTFFVLWWAHIRWASNPCLQERERNKDRHGNKNSVGEEVEGSNGMHAVTRKILVDRLGSWHHARKRDYEGSRWGEEGYWIVVGGVDWCQYGQGGQFVFCVLFSFLFVFHIFTVAMLCNKELAPWVISKISFWNTRFYHSPTWRNMLVHLNVYQLAIKYALAFEGTISSISCFDWKKKIYLQTVSHQICLYAKLKFRLLM